MARAARQNTVVIGTLLAGIFGLVALTNCSSDDPRAPAPPTGVTTTTTNSTGSMGGQNASAGGAGGSMTSANGGSGGSSAEGGSGGSGGMPMPTDENCYDGLDNDLDNKIDCTTPDDDCSAVCANACAQPFDLPDPTELLEHNNLGHSKLAGTSCVSNSGGGATNVYKIKTQKSGVLEVTLENIQGDFTLSVRDKCNDATTEQGRCSERATDQTAAPYTEFIRFNVIKDETYFIVVEEFQPGQGGNFYLTARSRPIECSDGITDDVEECDDGNLIDNDGCSSQCKLEANESEPNDTVFVADPYVPGFIGKIDPANDVDCISVNVQGANRSIYVSLADAGTGFCSSGFMDPLLQIYDANNSLIGSDDDSGDTFCPLLGILGLMTSGDHKVCVKTTSNSQGLKSVYPYSLFIELATCGDNVVEGAEDCDDGNILDNDGCSSICKME
jgi:cysteine-rich repeat protein